MSFVHPAFPLLLAAVVAAHRVVPSSWRPTILLLGSVLFYGWGQPSLLLLLFGVGVSDWALALVVEQAENKRPWITLAVLKDVGMLVWFKFLGPAVGLPVFVPLGLAFYGLQSLGYVLDVASGRIRARASLIDVLQFVSFFPQLVAGPVERAKELMPQLEARGVATTQQLRAGIVLLAWGAFQKMVVSDSLDPWVDRAFALNDPGGPIVWAASAAFMVQVYADLSGYTDLARGAALLIGITLSKNFNAPWRATTTSEFWSRWHLTVTRFVRDHLLGPLLGQGTPGPLRRVWATGMALFIMGVWHGSGWHFVIFGLFHAIITGFYTLLEPWAPWRNPRLRPFMAVFYLVFVGWVGAMIFREPSTPRMVGHLMRPFWVGTWEEVVSGLSILGLAMLLAVPLGIGQLVAERWNTNPRWVEQSPWSLPLQVFGVSLMLAAVFVMWRPTDADFLYFVF
ncbi:MAG TPA: MBOAT family protein [Deltaproteobacteria bacterium]|nr:MBOAT family protein [Deltaproteobacteria bacterium]